MIQIIHQMRRSRIKNIRVSFKRYLTITKEPVDVKTYTDINKAYNKFLIKKLLEGHEVTLPARLGTVCIYGKEEKVSFDENGKMRGLAPNWAETKKLWDRDPVAKAARKRVFCINSATDNVRYRYTWSKFNVLAPNKNLYSLIFTRENKRAVHKKVVSGFRGYIVKLTR